MHFYPIRLLMRESRLEKLCGYNKLLFHERYTACDPIRKIRHRAVTIYFKSWSKFLAITNLQTVAKWKQKWHGG